MTKTINDSGVGNAINRVEGHLKVMGKAKYATEFPVENKVYGQGINSTIAKGEIVSIDTSEAEKLKGVLKVITYKNATKLKTFDEEMPELTTDSIAPVLQSNKVHYYGEYVGLVVAETFEQAQYAARLVKFEYKKIKGEMLLNINHSNINSKTVGTSTSLSREQLTVLFGKQA